MVRAAVDTPQPMYVMMLKANLSVVDNYEKWYIPSFASNKLKLRVL